MINFNIIELVTLMNIEKWGLRKSIVEQLQMLFLSYVKRMEDSPSVRSVDTRILEGTMSYKFHKCQGNDSDTLEDLKGTCSKNFKWTANHAYFQ